MWVGVWVGVWVCVILVSESAVAWRRYPAGHQRVKKRSCKAKWPGSNLHDTLLGRSDTAERRQNGLAVICKEYAMLESAPVLFETISMRSVKPICAPPRL